MFNGFFQKSSSKLIISNTKNYCKFCKISFQSVDTLKQHLNNIHYSQSRSIKKILILGGGFSGINLLRQTQKFFKNDTNVSITLVNKENFFMYTPMLPEVASGMIHPSDISIPIRTFCKQSTFIQSSVSSIDLDQQQVTINRSFDGKVETLDYDYLAISVGSSNNFFGNKNIETHAFTIKTIEDAIGIRNHVITMFEHADRTTNKNMQRKFLTFVVVGGGFAGVETIGELNHFVKESVKSYPNIDPENITMILISANSGLLPEINEKLSKFALNYLRKSGIQVLTNTKVIDADQDFVLVDGGKTIPCHTFIWSGGISVLLPIHSLNCGKDSLGRLCVDKFLRLHQYPNVFVLGDCASIIDPENKKPYPPTAQHAIQQSNVVSKNLNSLIKGRVNLCPISYKNKGMMATIGKRMGIVSIKGHNFHGFFAWFVWRFYYVLQIPTFEKRIKVILDWFIGMFFKPDLTCFGTIKQKQFDQIDYDDLPPLLEHLFPDLKEKSFSELIVR